MTIQITLNGSPVTLDAPLSLEALLAEHQLDPRQIAVERNLEIVPHSAYANTTLASGDAVEIIQFVGGG